MKKNEAFDSSDEYNFLIFITIAADRAPEPNLTPGLKNPGATRTDRKGYAQHFSTVVGSVLLLNKQLHIFQSWARDNR